MKVTVTSITGFADAFVAMYISKRNWTPELDKEIRDVCNHIAWYGLEEGVEATEKFNKWLDIACRMTKKHITIGKFIQICIMTEGLHRGGQDDIDSHAERFDNRIIRSSTRLATFDQDEFSDFYKNKVITTDKALEILGIDVPESIEVDGHLYTKCPNGYVRFKYKDDKDVLRGLYMLGIPSNFVSQINLSQIAHVYQQRGIHGGAHPEVKEWAESVASQLEALYPQINRELLLNIEN